jgi:hypothetical protein
MASVARVRAPELEGAGGFLNTNAPLSMRALRGRVVLLWFWRAGSVACLGVREELRELESRFGDDLVVVGVHSPQLPQERRHAAVVAAVERHRIAHAVLDDAGLATWEAYDVRVWPTLVLVDPEGYVVLEVAGEGNGRQVAEAVDTLIAAHDAKGTLVRGRMPRLEPPTPDVPHTALRFPSAVAFDQERGLMAVADAGNDRVVLLGSGGVVSAVVGSGAPGHLDGAFADAAFRAPRGLCFWRGALWVADTGNDRLRRVDLRAQAVETVGGRLRAPWGLSPFGESLVVSLAGSHQLWSFDHDTARFSTLAGNGREALADGRGPKAELAEPAGLAALGGMLGVVDAGTSALRVGTLEAGSLELTTLVGRGSGEVGDADGTGTAARLQHPLGLAVEDGGWIVADSYNHRLRRFSLRTGLVTTVAGGEPGLVDGPAAAARFDEPSGVVVVGRHAIVADTNNHALRTVDLEAGVVGTLMPAGLSAPGRAPQALPPATLVARSQCELEIGVPAPEGWRLRTGDTQAVRVRVTADPPGLLAAPVDAPCAGLPARAALATLEGSGRLHVQVRAVLERDGAARLVEAAYVVPVTLAYYGVRDLALG